MDFVCESLLLQTRECFVWMAVARDTCPETARLAYRSVLFVPRCEAAETLWHRHGDKFGHLSLSGTKSE
jgi:hypothetical protein